MSTTRRLAAILFADITDEAFRMLKMAAKEGDILSNIDYENDPLMSDLHQIPQWIEVVNFWKPE